MPCTVSEFSPIWESACKHSRFKLIKFFCIETHFTGVVLKKLIVLEDACMLVRVAVLYVKNVLTQYCTMDPSRNILKHANSALF